MEKVVKLEQQLEALVIKYTWGDLLDPEYYTITKTEIDEHTINKLLDALLCTLYYNDFDCRSKQIREMINVLNVEEVSEKRRDRWFMDIHLLKTKNNYVIALVENSDVEIDHIFIVLNKNRYSKSYIKQFIRNLAKLLIAGMLLDEVEGQLIGRNYILIRTNEILEYVLKYLESNKPDLK